MHDLFEKGEGRIYCESILNHFLILEKKTKKFKNNDKSLLDGDTF